MRRALFAVTLLAAVAPASIHGAWAANRHTAAAAANGDAVALALDEVHTIAFRAPVATVYVGNPSIADITMIDASTDCMPGMGTDSTNIVALNHDGEQVYNARVDVAQSGTETLTLNRGIHRVTYNCNNGRCEMSPTPGDAKDMFDQIAGETTGHAEAARKAAGGN